MFESMERRFRRRNAFTVNAETESDVFFRRLEEGIRTSRFITVEGCMKDYGHEQILMRFIDKYKMFLDYYHTDMGGRHGRCFLAFKTTLAADSAHTYDQLAAAYTKDYYMNDCGGYDVFQQWGGHEIEQRLRDVYYLINPGESDNILDIGCGRGELAHALSESGANVTGVDYSEDAISIARKTFGEDNDRLRYVCEDIFRLKGMEKYDKFVMADVVEHIDQDVLEKIFARVAEVMSEKGVLVIHTAPNSDYYEHTYPRKREEAVGMGFYLQENPRSYYEQLMHINEQSPGRLEEALKRSFPCVHVWTGSVVEIAAEKTVEETYEDNQIFAYACRNLQSLKSIMEEMEKSPVYENCEIEIRAEDIECAADREVVELEAAVRNLGEEHLTSRRKRPIYLSYHIYDEKDELLIYDGERTAVDRVLRRGESARIRMKIRLPESLAARRRLKIAVTMVAEGCFWFDREGKNCTYISIVRK